MLHLLLSLIILTFISFYSDITLAHCDTMDGPVISDAQKALKNKKVDAVLKWVTPNDEKEVLTIFQRTLEVRSLGRAAQELADEHFFEALVRIHRASEGECFTGIKPSGSVEPSIVATDKALRNGDIASLANELSINMREGIIDRFEKAYKLQKSSDKSVKQGREFVQAYIELTHYVEEVHQIITKGAGHKHRKE